MSIKSTLSQFPYHLEWLSDQAFEGHKVLHFQSANDLPIHYCTKGIENWFILIVRKSFVQSRVSSGYWTSLCKSVLSNLSRNYIRMMLACRGAATNSRSNRYFPSGWVLHWQWSQWCNNLVLVLPWRCLGITSSGISLRLSNSEPFTKKQPLPLITNFLVPYTMKIKYQKPLKRVEYTEQIVEDQLGTWHSQRAKRPRESQQNQNGGRGAYSLIRGRFFLRWNHSACSVERAYSQDKNDEVDEDYQENRSKLGGVEGNTMKNTTVKKWTKERN